MKRLNRAQSRIAEATINTVPVLEQEGYDSKTTFIQEQVLKRNVDNDCLSISEKSARVKGGALQSIARTVELGGEGLEAGEIPALSRMAPFEEETDA